MIIDVNGAAAHAATGGVQPTGDDPAVILIHGAGMDATVWYLQTRYLAYRNLRVFAIDLPGHGRSEGEPIDSIESMADWVIAFADAAALDEVHVVGHSMGTFIALELASRYAQRIESITLCGTATAMPVHPQLLDDASNNLPAAAALMTAWSHAKPAHVGTHPTPGLWMLGGAQALVENSAPGALRTDFAACAAYDRAEIAAAAVQCRATVVAGLGDKMTPAKSGRALAQHIDGADIVDLPGVGHMMMTENPRAVKQAIVHNVRRS